MFASFIHVAAVAHASSFHLWLSNTPWCGYASLHLPIHQATGIWVVSTFLAVTNTFMHKCLLVSICVSLWLIPIPVIPGLHGNPMFWVLCFISKVVTELQGVTHNLWGGSLVFSPQEQHKVLVAQVHVAHLRVTGSTISSPLPPNFGTGWPLFGKVAVLMALFPGSHMPPP